MNHQAAILVFEEIRNRPYAWSCKVNVPANNCYFKGIELLQRLGILGYHVRGRVGETFLSYNIPAKIRAQYPAQILLTHFWVEVELDGEWKVMDPSYDPGLRKAGFIVNEWDSNQTCFQITRAYNQEEAINYQLAWNDADKIKKYFDEVGPFAELLNRWFEQVRAGS